MASTGIGHPPRRNFGGPLTSIREYATAHHWYAWHLSLMGRHGEAIAEMRKARSLDPLSLIINADLAEVLLIAHFYDESVQQSRKTIDMDPDFALAHNQLAEAYSRNNMRDDAITEFQKAVQLSERQSDLHSQSGSRLRVSRQECRGGTTAGRSEEALESCLFECGGDRHGLCRARRERPKP